MTELKRPAAPSWTRLLLGAFAVFALGVGLLELTSPGQFGIDPADPSEYLAMETGVARNLALGIFFAVVAWRGRAGEVALALALRALVDLLDLALLLRGPEVSIPSAAMATVFCVAAALGAVTAARADRAGARLQVPA